MLFEKIDSNEEKAICLNILLDIDEFCKKTVLIII